MNDRLPVRASAPPPPAPNYQNLEPMEEGGGSASPFQVRRFLSFLRRFWWIPLFTLTLALGSAIGYIFWKPTTYVSTAVMWETAKVRLPEASLMSEDQSTFLGTQTELLKSPHLQAMTLESLKTSSTNAIPVGRDGKPLRVKITVSPVPKSSVFNVSASGSDPAYLQRYLDALLVQYLAYKKEIRQVVSGGTFQSIGSQVEKFENDKMAAQRSLAAFQSTNNLAILQEEATLASGYLTKLKTQLSDLQIESEIISGLTNESNATSLGQTNTPADLLEVMRSLGSTPASAAPSERQTALREIEMLKIQREKLSQYLLPKHPKMVKLQADIDRAQTILDMFRNHSLSQLTASLNAAKMKMTKVQEAIEVWEGKVIRASTNIAIVEGLKLEVNRNQGLLDRLKLMMDNVDISRKIEQEALAVLQPASPGVSSTKEDAMVLALAVIVGLGLGLGIIFLIGMVDDRLISLTEVTEKLGEHVVGQLPEVVPPRRKARVPLLEINDERHMYAESYRNLRSALLFMPSEEERPKTLVITSAQPDEGKSTVAANLARTLALGGASVLLVDADLRRGVLHELMSLQREPGLADLLAQPTDFDKVLQTNCQPNLTFLSCGTRLRNSGELFLSPAFDQLLARMRTQFDFVIFDSCPVFAADDATTLAPKVDATILVVRSSFSSARLVREALDLLYQRQARVLGLVFNRADTTANSYYYYKYSKYHPEVKKA